MPTVGKVKDYLVRFLEELEEYDEDEQIKTYTNTYFVHTDHYMQFGYAGFIAMDKVEIEGQDDYDEEDYDEEDY